MTAPSTFDAALSGLLAARAERDRLWAARAELLVKVREYDTAIDAATDALADAQASYYQALHA